MRLMTMERALTRPCTRIAAAVFPSHAASVIARRVLSRSSSRPLERLMPHVLLLVMLLLWGFSRVLGLKL